MTNASVIQFVAGFKSYGKGLKTPKEFGEFDIT